MDLICQSVSMQRRPHRSNSSIPAKNKQWQVRGKQHTKTPNNVLRDISNSSGLMNTTHNIHDNLPPITCMVWNVQGAGSREIIQTHKPMVLALVETHMGGQQASKIATMLHYNGHTRVDAQGFSGGIWVYWKPELVTINPIEQHNQYITMEITRNGETPWYFTAIYASPDPTKRHELWQNLEEFAHTNGKPWMLAGDFNETRYGWERNSSCSETTRRSVRFNHWIESNQLLEVEFSGPSHTWARGNSVETRAGKN
ncbi:uncharacterized protein [Spinacia oleracea]|uniref:Endonuclease/exonuclease/phosphatase domain-containing protein n=1 Tax=Spinacia oleracea TaxID=3562 RepID=A0A9R0I5W7_SPIOL|nr:uncharacterized protein LOC110783228 [Spinacia oleracea]